MEREFSGYSDTLIEGTTQYHPLCGLKMQLFDVTARSIKFLYFLTLNLYNLSFCFS